jgi:hypothetical protein
MCQCDGTSREEKFDSRCHPDGTGRRGRPKKKAVVVPAPAPVPALAKKVAVRNSAKKARKRIRGDVQQSKAVAGYSGDERWDLQNDGVSGSSADEGPPRFGKVQGELSNANQLALALGKQNTHTKIITGDFAKSSASLDEKARVSKACMLLAPDDAEGLAAAFFEDRAPVSANETNLLRVVSDMQAALPPRCDQRRVLVAALCASQTKAAASQCIKPLGKHLYHAASSNASFLLNGHQLVTVPPTRQRYSKSIAEHAVQFILHRTQQESWGSTDYIMDNLTKEVSSSISPSLPYLLCVMHHSRFLLLSNVVPSLRLDYSQFRFPLQSSRCCGDQPTARKPLTSHA